MRRRGRCAEVGHLELAHRYAREAALVDLRDLHHNSGDGVHIAPWRWTSPVGRRGRTCSTGVSWSRPSGRTGCDHGPAWRRRPRCSPLPSQRCRGGSRRCWATPRWTPGPARSSSSSSAGLAGNAVVTEAIGLAGSARAECFARAPRCCDRPRAGRERAHRRSAHRRSAPRRRRRRQAAPGVLTEDVGVGVGGIAYLEMPLGALERGMGLMSQVREGLGMSLSPRCSFTATPTKWSTRQTARLSWRGSRRLRFPEPARSCPKLWALGGPAPWNSAHLLSARLGPLAALRRGSVPVGVAVRRRENVRVAERQHPHHQPRVERRRTPLLLTTANGIYGFVPGYGAPATLLT